ncbi:HK97 family phage prohead protease [Microbacterium sp. SL75]|uniref:HK97 family phage prohead protease n=1 Tax=Microbacterium sp. SL75 TaxID=2995140 RepID=UPI00226FC4EA|nr:HK97 family phage prohead protease [Microbacterium sp. SL75]WAC68901.1 HK97 family phage prohead protease [Microbacterium sp. SL75]
MTDQRAAPEVERRTFASEVTFRAAPEGADSAGILTGRAIAFNSSSRTLYDWWYGEFTEQIDPRALGEPTAEGGVDLATHTRVIARTNHNSDYLLGVTDAGTLRLFLGDEGVDYEIDLPNTTYGRDLAVSARRGDYRYSSFAFRVLPDGEEWSYGENDQLVRRITGLRLIDVAPVADPAYWGSSAEMLRSFDLSAIRARLDAERAGGEPPAPAPTETQPDQRTLLLSRAREIELTL